MGIKTAPNEFAGDGDISDGDNMCSGLNWSTNNYDIEIKDIAILPDRSKKKEEHLTPGEQFALRSELGKLMRIARISRPDALRGASVQAQTFDEDEETIFKPDRFCGYRRRAFSESAMKYITRPHHRFD